MILSVKAGVQFGGLKDEMMVVLDVAPIVFAQLGYDCWLTCACTPRDSGLHPHGLALDFDSSANVPQSTGHEMANRVREILGPGYDVLWHKTASGHWHLHTEYDPK